MEHGKWTLTIIVVLGAGLQFSVTQIIPMRTGAFEDERISENAAEGDTPSCG
jgi:hypothetical protein